MNRISSFSGEYRWLSNFWIAPIIPFNDNISYPSSEHAYQAAKTQNLEIRKTIASNYDPRV
jgi:hypothetical protein